jgi:hypothetical protein
MFSPSEEHNNGKVQSHAQFQSLTESVSLSLSMSGCSPQTPHLEVQLWELLGDLAVRNSKGEDVSQSLRFSQILSALSPLRARPPPCGCKSIGPWQTIGYCSEKAKKKQKNESI